MQWQAVAPRQPESILPASYLALFDPLPLLTYQEILNKLLLHMKLRQHRFHEPSCIAGGWLLGRRGKSACKMPIRISCAAAARTRPWLKSAPKGGPKYARTGIGGCIPPPLHPVHVASD